MKKLTLLMFATFGLLARPATAVVYPQYQSVLISTSPTYSHANQNGAIDISSATVRGPFVATGTVTLGSSANSVTISSNVVLGGAIILGGSPGTVGQVPSSNGPGAAQSYITPATLAGIISTTSTWTAQQTFSSATVNVLNVGSIKSTTTAVGLMTNSCGYLMGAFVQMVSSSTVTVFSTTSNAFANTALGLSITPKCATDKVLLQMQSVCESDTNSLAIFGTFARGGSNLLGSNGGLQLSENVGSLASFTAPCSLLFLDSPSSISAQTYQVQVKNSNNTNSVFFGNTNVTQYMLATEIAQ